MLPGRMPQKTPNASYDAFGLIGSNFSELAWKTLTFFAKPVLISPNASQALGLAHHHAAQRLPGSEDPRAVHAELVLQLVEQLAREAD
jgi:hypothetical protein